MNLYLTKQYNPKPEGSGSAENKNEGREFQKAAKTEVRTEERADIAAQTGLQSSDIADLRETGALSGRDDLSGGSGDGMENTSDNEPTERF